ncbi:MAG TPA: hypothetical protein VF144_18350 [Chitinophagaceae bacterium]
MEVHQHTHTLRKKWAHYFWEFLMLFLALFCGFLAEYQLEHKIERDREKDYMRGMLDDLSSDTAQINEVLIFCRSISKGLDSLTQNLYNTQLAQKNAGTIYRQYGTYLRRFGVRFSDQTAIQLRNSGQLRLIRRKKVMDQVSVYWLATSQVERIQDRIEEALGEISSHGDDIINAKFLGEYGERDSASGIWFIKVLPGGRNDDL